MEQEQKQQPRPMNIFEAINQNIVDMSQDNVATNELIQGIDAKVDAIAAKVDATVAKIDAIYAALYPAMPNEIPEGSPKDPGEEEGFENE